MRDLVNPKLMWFKAALFLVIGMGAALLIFGENASLRTAVLLILAIWGFCRAYYFAFYVIEHYVDGNFHFSGLFSFFSYVLRKRSGGK